MTVRALIVDDEGLARRRIRRLLAAHKSVEVIGECSGGAAAVEAITTEKPDLVFLDVQMPDLDGFGVLAKLDQATLPTVIFVTAYDQYALRAFEACAIDYLVKPYAPQRFGQAVDRALRWIESGTGADNEEKLRRLLREVLHGEQAERSTPAAESPSFDRFVVKRNERTQFVRAEEVDWIESDGNYVKLHVGTASHVVRSTITACEEQMDPRRFVRVHRRYLVNMDRIKEVQPWFGGDSVIMMQNGQQLRLSRNYREHFQSRMRGG
jgi:two-component system LytT family response regulator